MNFTNKTIWITGATSGIGQELAHQFAEKGARLVLSARREELLNDMRANLPGGHSKHWVVPMDLANGEELMATAQTALDEIGPVDILINNGGISQRSFFLETDLEVYRRLMDVNYLGTVALTKVVLPGMVERQNGSVVCISSVAGKIGSKLRTGYSGAKFAVVGFMDCLRAEVHKDNVHCLTVCPGSIQTNIAINALDAHGDAQNKNDESIESGMEVQTCCEQIIKAIEQRKDEVVIGKGISAMAPTIKRFFPGLFNALSARSEYR